MIELVKNISREIESKIIKYRRDFHKYAEMGWTEFRTSSHIAQRLNVLGYDIKIGKEVIKPEDRMGLPDDEILEQNWQRAMKQGAVQEYMEALRGGYTGVVGIFKNGEGPTVGIRFDIDALEVNESPNNSHRPFQENFSSVNSGVMHACGHDAHAAVGLGVAEVLIRMKDRINGTIKLIFQPAEEGVRGAKSMVSAGVVDDLDYLFAHHLYSGWESGNITCGMGGYLATEKFDAIFKGKPAHAAASPQDGKNAMLAAATAVLNLHAIPRHKDGTTRINVGKFIAGTGRNVICPHAKLVIETRGKTTELNEYMYNSALRILHTAAEMYECELEITAMGGAKSGESDEELKDHVEKVAAQLGEYMISPPEGAGGSEDYTYMMERVQKNGGLATNIGVGADSGGGGHHTSEFDINEQTLIKAVNLLSLSVLDLLKK